MEEKLYTSAEANELLPFLAPTLVELREKFEEAAKLRAGIAEAAFSNGGSPQKDQWERKIARVQELSQRLEEWGVVLRDIATGLVDFPAIVDGQEAWLCWRLGEATVTFWHLRTESFAQRRPL